MADPASLSSIISSLLAAFDSGYEVFRRLVAKYRKGLLRRKQRVRLDKDDRLLEESFSKHPKRIRTEYEEYSARHGQRFKHGDDISRTCLAHILLKLNSGLAKIIETFLIRSSKDYSQAHRSLLHLTESSSSHTLQTLSQFHNRLGRSKLSLDLTSAGSKCPPPARSRSASVLTDKKKSPARKQFVRSKSDPEIKVENAPLDSPKSRPGPTKKRKRSNSFTRSAKTRSTRTGSSDSVPYRQPLMAINPRLGLQQSNANYTHDLRARRRRPVSTLTFQSDSTKIGEIPVENLGGSRLLLYSDAAGSQEEALQWWPPQPPLKKRKRRFGDKLKFWR